VPVATYIAGVTLFDGHSFKKRAGVLVSDGKIEWVGAHVKAPREARAAEAIDGAGRTVTPGLVDCHVHLCFDGSADFAAEALELTEARATLKAVRNLRRHLEHGVTTVRDLGGPSTYTCEVARAVEEGIVEGPRVVASGQAITITGGHGRDLFALEADGPDGVRAAVRRQFRAGARSIKVIATGGVLTPGITVDFTAFTPEELAAAVDEAHKWGRPVAAHAHGETGISNAVRSGVDSIEHGSQITAEVARMMKEKGTFHVPTIIALRQIVEHPDDVPAYAVEKGNQMAHWAEESFRRTSRTGVRIACGTDAGTPFNPHGSAPLEMVRMVEWGFDPVSALKAATSNAAALLREETIGSVEEGKVADLVLFDGDPAEDIEIVLKPFLVLRAGQRVA
jgi:imidazolonepropionase-like amidohydrolase